MRPQDFARSDKRPSDFARKGGGEKDGKGGGAAGGGHALGGGDPAEVTKNVCVGRADGCVRICGRTADEERFVNFCSSPRFVNSEGSDNDKGKCVFIKLGLKGVCKGFSVTATATLEMFWWPFLLCAGGSSAGVLHTCPFVLSEDYQQECYIFVPVYKVKQVN